MYRKKNTTPLQQPGHGRILHSSTKRSNSIRIFKPDVFFHFWWKLCGTYMCKYR